MNLPLSVCRREGVRTGSKSEDLPDSVVSQAFEEKLERSKLYVLYSSWYGCNARMLAELFLIIINKL